MATDSPAGQIAVAGHHEETEAAIGSLREMLAGGIAGITEHAVMFPFDTIKTKLQQQGSHFKSTSECLMHIVRNEKWTHLYRGCVPIVASAFPAHGAYFGCYEATKRAISADNSLAYAAAAVSATVAHDFVSVPFDVVKQRMQVDTRHKHSLACLRSVVRDHGVGKLFQSYPATVLMNIPHIVTQWVVYEACKEYLQSRGLLEYDWSPYYLAAGGFAGACAATASTPFDVVKTRVQLHEGRIPMGTIIADVYSTSGYRGFFRGAVPRIMCIAPSAAIVLSTYEVCKRLFKIEIPLDHH